MSDCHHPRACTYLEQMEGEPVFIVRQCPDCHAEIVRREIKEETIEESIQRQPALINE